MSSLRLRSLDHPAPLDLHARRAAALRFGKDDSAAAEAVAAATAPDNTPTREVVLVKEEKQKILKDGRRPLTEGEEAAYQKSAQRWLSTMFPNANTPVHEFAASPEARASIVGHAVGIPMGVLGGLISRPAEFLGILARDLGVVAVDAWRALTNLSAEPLKQLPEHLQNPFSIHEGSVPGAILGASFGLIPAFFALKKQESQNQTIRAYMERLPENATYFNLIADESVQKERGYLKDIKVHDTSVESWLNHFFTGQSHNVAIPERMLPKDEFQLLPSFFPFHVNALNPITWFNALNPFNKSGKGN